MSDIKSSHMMNVSRCCLPVDGHSSQTRSPSLSTFEKQQPPRVVKWQEVVHVADGSLQFVRYPANSCELSRGE